MDFEIFVFRSFVYQINWYPNKGLSLLSLMVLNVIPGLVVDAMRHKFAKPYDADYGAALGLSISMTICVTLLVSYY